VFVANASDLAYLEYTGGGHLANLRRNAKVAVVSFDPEAEPRYVRSMEKRSCSRQELFEMSSELELIRSSWPKTPMTRASSCESASTKQ
jgi:hypothetical protein